MKSSTFIERFLISCIILNENRRTKMGEAWERGQVLWSLSYNQQLSKPWSSNCSPLTSSRSTVLINTAYGLYFCVGWWISIFSERRDSDQRLSHWCCQNHSHGVQYRLFSHIRGKVRFQQLTPHKSSIFIAWQDHCYLSSVLIYCMSVVYTYTTFQL